MKRRMRLKISPVCSSVDPESLDFSKKVKRTRPAAGSSKKNATTAEDGSSAAGPARAKALTEVHVEYSKKTADDPFRGPRNYTELQAIINDEPWIV